MSYDSEVAADSPLVYLKLDETSGTTAADGSGNGRDFSISSATLNQTGLVLDGGKSYDFNGSSSQVTLADAAWQRPAAFTVEVWFNADDVSFKALAGKDVPGGGWAFYVSSGQLNFFVPGLGSHAGSTTVSTGGTHHAVITYDSTVAKLYLDGVLDGTYSFTVNQNPGADLMVGVSTGSNGGGSRFFFWDGRLDNFAYYGSALSGTRVAAHYSAGTTSSGPITGSLDAVLPGLTSDFGGDYTSLADPAITGELDAVLPVLVSDFAGDYTAPALVGSLDAVLPSMESFFVGDYDPPVDPPPAVIVAAGGGAGSGGAEGTAVQNKRFDQTWVLADPEPDAFGQATNVDYTRVRSVKSAAGRPRITVDGVDVTFFRSHKQPMVRPGYQTAEPLVYDTSESLLLKNVFGGREDPPAWVRKGARVTYGRVMPDGSRPIDYRGRVLAVRVQGYDLLLDIGGDPTAFANLQYRPKPLFRSKSDLGAWAYQCATAINMHMVPPHGPDTGIVIQNRGDMSQAAFLSLLCQLSQNADGNQRAFRPTTAGGRVFELVFKNTTSKHFTLYPDDGKIVVDLVDDITEQPNEFYVEGVTPDGLRVRNGRYPGFQAGDAPTFPGSLSSGDSGEDVIVLASKLEFMNYLPNDHPLDVFDGAVVKAVKKLQRDAGLTPSGVVDSATWQALFNVNVTGASVEGAEILPVVYDRRTQRWNRDATGERIGLNPDFDPDIPRVSHMYSGLDNMEKADMVDYAETQRNRSSGANWQGTITLAPSWGGIRGEHNPGDGAISEGDVFPAADMDAGQNVWLPTWPGGGILLHVSGANHAADGTTTLTVDTQARDLLEVQAIHERDAESRRDIRREWDAQNRPNKSAAAMVTYDEFGGVLFDDWSLQGHHWNRIPVIMGQTGNVGKTVIRLTNDAEFAAAATSRPIEEGRFGNVVGNPFTKNGAGETTWEQGGTVGDWLEDETILWAEGDGDQPAGYSPRAKMGEKGPTGAPRTGRLFSTASWPYKTFRDTQAVIYLWIWPDRDCKVRAGRVFWKLEDDAV